MRRMLVHALEAPQETNGCPDGRTQSSGNEGRFLKAATDHPGWSPCIMPKATNPKLSAGFRWAERYRFPRMEASRILKPVDDQPVWSVSCFLHPENIPKNRGLSVRLLEAACDFARADGADMIEGYPIDTPKANYPARLCLDRPVSHLCPCRFSPKADRRSPTPPHHA